LRVRPVDVSLRDTQSRLLLVRKLPVGNQKPPSTKRPNQRAVMIARNLAA
jgi:hypothetical protein